MISSSSAYSLLLCVSTVFGEVNVKIRHEKYLFGKPPVNDKGEGAENRCEELRKQDAGLTLVKEEMKEGLSRKSFILQCSS